MNGAIRAEKQPTTKLHLQVADTYSACQNLLDNVPITEVNALTPNFILLLVIQLVGLGSLISKQTTSFFSKKLCEHKSAHKYLVIAEVVFFQFL